MGGGAHVAQQPVQPLEGGHPGDIHRSLVHATPYATGTPLFHDNFSPYDYNYYHERRHRVNVLRDEQERRRQLQWEGIEKANAQYAWNVKRQQQGLLPDNAQSPYASANLPPRSMVVTYTAPEHFPENLNDPAEHGLRVDVPAAPNAFTPVGAPQFVSHPHMMPVIR